MLYRVDTLVQFKHSYFIECKEESDALDTVAMDEAEEAYQEYLGETIFSSKPVTKSEFREYMVGTPNAHMGTEIIHKVDYNR